MCGIIGYIGKKEAKNILLEGLRRLEYRGYDSAGLSVLNNNSFQTHRTLGRVEALSKETLKAKIQGALGIAHTRWATHGEVAVRNTHPHTSSDGKFVLVHNGVIENYIGIKRFLSTKGYTFSSETDTEVLCNLIAYHYEKETVEPTKNRFLMSVCKSLRHVEGTYGIAVVCIDYPDEFIGARKGSPLILGVGTDENILASDVSAIVMRTQNVVYLKDNEIVHIKSNDFNICTLDEEDVEAVIHKVDWTIDQAELGDFDHFMEKEIFEQPQALENAMRGRFSDDHSTAVLGGLNLTSQELRHIDRILLCGCGTAWHACLVAEYLIERYARIPVEVEYASEFRYRNAPLDKNTLVFIISQSGETIDSLAALREAQRKGYKTLAITNVVGSTIARESDGGLYQHAGPEIGVASTKAFTSQIVLSAMIALYLGRLRNMSHSEGQEIVKALKELPKQINTVLEQASYIQEIAKKYAHYEDFLFLGRQALFPIALEGALKLKEISYIHAEGYPAAEIKHGPIALVSEQCPSFFLAPQNEVYHKTLSNIQEIKVRKGKVIAIVTEGSDFPENLADDIIYIPNAHEIVHPILATIPVQLFSYFVAVERKCDVDKPRNLAKSVTVE